MRHSSPYSQQKTTYIIIITIILTISLIVMLFGCCKNNGTDDQGSSEQNAASSGETVSPENDIYFVGKDVIVTRTELEEANDFYLQAGYSDGDAFDQAVLYVQKYETMYFLATKAGYKATEEDLKERIDYLKEISKEIKDKEEFQAMIDSFESEEAYWEYERLVLIKDIAIEKYREAEIKPEFDKITAHEPGSEEYWAEWGKWYEDYQIKMVEEQEFQLKSDLDD